MNDNTELPPLASMPSAFRVFCNHKWFEHKDEIFAWTGEVDPGYDSSYYFKRHRWLLKAMFKKEQGK